MLSLHCIFHIFSTVISATGWAAVARSIGDGQALWDQLRVCFFCGALTQMEEQMEAKWMMEVNYDNESEDAIGCRNPCHIYE